MTRDAPRLPPRRAGIDVPAVTAWLAGAAPSSSRRSASSVIGEGQSNLTFRVDGRRAAASVVLRGPPLGEILASAHDMAREHRILTGLAPAARACHAPSPSARTRA